LAIGVKAILRDRDASMGGHTNASIGDCRDDSIGDLGNESFGDCRDDVVPCDAGPRAHQSGQEIRSAT
jgi:hypothetical protein